VLRHLSKPNPQLLLLETSGNGRTKEEGGEVRLSLARENVALVEPTVMGNLAGRLFVHLRMDRRVSHCISFT
jgi:hypothetical protein